MSRTKRVYNFPNSPISVWNHDKGWKPYWHPYKRIWSNKSFEWKYYEFMSKRRRDNDNQEIKREVNNLCPLNSLVGKNECFSCSMRWYDGNCEYMDEINFK